MIKKISEQYEMSVFINTITEVKVKIEISNIGYYTLSIPPLYAKAEEQIEILKQVISNIEAISNQ